MSDVPNASSTVRKNTSLPASAQIYPTYSPFPSSVSHPFTQFHPTPSSIQPDSSSSIPSHRHVSSLHSFPSQPTNQMYGGSFPSQPTNQMYGGSFPSQPTNQMYGGNTQVFPNPHWSHASVDSTFGSDPWSLTNSVNLVSSCNNTWLGVNFPQPTSGDGSVRGIRVANKQIWDHVQIVNSSSTVHTCPICLEECVPGGQDPDTMVVNFKQCNDHHVHLDCLNRMVEAKQSPGQSLYLECPHCMKRYGCGVRTGNQPPGSMTCSIMNQSLPGHPGTQTIQITYQIYAGVQDSSHPNPGERYSASNFPRTCYLPDTEKGRLVRDLLKIAFDRKLIFTIGTSATTGRSNVVIWNDIHHKTEWNNYSGHGYPDPGYLDRCLYELANQGVTEQDLHVS